MGLVKRSALSTSIGSIPYQVNLSFPTSLHAKHKRLFKAGCRIAESKECLVWSLRCFTVGGSEL
jgi:hypothetical protein